MKKLAQPNHQPGQPGRSKALSSESFLVYQQEIEVDQFYLQDSRTFVGNDMLFWAKDGNGYTTDVSKAHVYSRAEAVDMHQSRNSDVPWPKSYIDTKTRPAVDMQYTRIADALQGTGVVLVKTKPLRMEKLRCQQCNSFISTANFWHVGCTRCGADSRP